MNNDISQIRKVAILVESLDSAGADAMLAQLDSETAARIRQAVMELDNVTVEQRDRVIAEFMRVGAMVPDQSHAGIELDDSLVRRLAGNEPQEHSDTEGVASESDRPPFCFLHEASGETLAPLLMRENPQTIAVVLSRLPPERASDALTRLAPKVQAAVIRRIVHLDEADPEIVRQIEQEFNSLLCQQMETARKRQAGLSTMNRILSAGDQENRNNVLADLAKNDESLALRLGHVSRATQPPASTRGTATPPGTHRSLASLENRTPIRTSRQQAPRRVAAAQSVTARSVTTRSATVEFASLERLDSAAWVKVLRTAEADVALLALTGASPRLVDRVLMRLPTREARALRNKMEQPGPVNLRDVERAQCELARLAGQLAEQGQIRLPVSLQQTAAVA